jgi:proteasome beta subunit
MAEIKKPEIRESGTTTVGMICRDGVVLAAEKKSTLGYLVASKEAEKIIPIDEHIAITTAGASGDAQALARIMKAELKLFRIRNKRRITVKGAATLLANILQSGRWTLLPYMVQLILAGYDTKPAVFTLDAIGSIEEEKKFFATGSGSPIALGVLEDAYKEGMTTEEGGKLALRSIKAAIERDIASGGKAIDIAVITEKGIKITRHDLTK